MKNKENLEKTSKQHFENFQYLRQTRVSYFQAFYVAIIVAGILIILNYITDDLIQLEDPFLSFILKMGLLLAFLLLLHELYTHSIKQTQKPVFIAENLTATIESKPVLVKGKDGKGYYVFKMSDVIHKRDRKTHPKR